MIIGGGPAAGSEVRFTVFSSFAAVGPRRMVPYYGTKSRGPGWQHSVLPYYGHSVPDSANYSDSYRTSGSGPAARVKGFGKVCGRGESGPSHRPSSLAG
eukprot:126747-Hanusia_phi.AAC.1